MEIGRYLLRLKDHWAFLILQLIDMGTILKSGPSVLIDAIPDGSDQGFEFSLSQFFQKFKVIFGIEDSFEHFDQILFLHIHIYG